jgi:nicotinate-nucleotide adenylyltransferase
MNIEPSALVPYLPSPKNIGICGGSFSPPHIGHSSAILYAMAMYDLDQIWVIPCGKHAEGKVLIEFEHRCKMCQIAFTRIRNCRVLWLEHYLPKPSFTNNTLRFIKNKERNANLHLILGEDSYSTVDVRRRFVQHRSELGGRFGGNGVSKTHLCTS